MWAAEGESDYCFRPNTNTKARLELDIAIVGFTAMCIGKGCLHMDGWMSQYSFRGLTVHMGFLAAVIHWALVFVVS